VLEPLDHLVQADLVGARERARNDARAGHHPEIDLPDRGDPLLEHEAALDERLQREAFDERSGVDLSFRAHRSPFRS
jgi:hypothetical protein